jgi:YfiH family protein
MVIFPKIFEGLNIVAAQSMRYTFNVNVPDYSHDRELFLEHIGVRPEQLAGSKLVHDNKVLVTDKPIISEGYDAIITNTPNVFATITTADCVPVLIYDTKNKAVASIHAGWKGTVARIVVETLKAMERNFGTKGEDCLAYIGACISEKSFEVGDEVAILFKENEKYYNKENEKYFVDLKSANKHQLLESGVKENNIEVSEYCTVLNNDQFYSYRKEHGKTGRMWALIGIRD